MRESQPAFVVYDRDAGGVFRSALTLKRCPPPSDAPSNCPWLVPPSRRSFRLDARARWSGCESLLVDLGLPPVATPHIASAPANSLRWITLVRLSGDGGTLTGLGVAGGPDYHHLRVALDGTTVVDEFLAGTGAANHVNNGIGVALPFSSDLKVDIRDEPTPSPITTFWVAYVTDNSEPISESTRIETLEGVEYRYRTEHYAKRPGGTYEVDTLIGPRFLARVEIDRDVIVLARYPPGRFEPFGPPESPAVGLRARASVWDTETAESVHFGALGAAIRVPGRSTILQEVSLEPSMSEIPVWFPPGEYSIATTSAEYANIPTYFTVL
jgi:hypothetical protein